MAKQESTRPSPERPRLVTGFAAGILYFFFVVGISAALAALAWQSARDVLGLMKTDHEATIVVKEGFDLNQLSKTLREEGIIDHSWLFTLYCRVSHSADKIHPGEYTLNALFDYRALVYNMRGTPAALEEIRIAIPEGLTLNQIIALLAENGVASEEDLRQTAHNYKYEYSFLSTIPFIENRLEGFLFPDTYDFYVGDNPVSVLNKMLSNFNRKFNPEYRERARELEMTISEIVTIASLIEKEAANDDERPLVASVIHNRLNSSNFDKLQIDATVQYILPEPKPRLLYEDLEIDDPYNTYLYDGLPPGPISAPGLESIRAALYPESTSYYFYALTDDYTHKFSRTKAEHDRVVNDNRAFYETLGG
ncbi:MAG: endolytic transglycosylase MltG [Oscillospiraceae bacterium]|nr:endolytic transglycosylase MltG [Oscillospiraceae bacterium]